MAITVMKRYELKYILNSEQTDYLCNCLKGHMKEDQYSNTTIASIYYDTPTYQLIRTSIEKPEFKEKIRLRSYGIATDKSPVYLELKRKADGIVYKRRVQTTISDADKFFSGNSEISSSGQINKEITTFRDYYKKLVPSCMIIYDRKSFYEPDGDLRLTIDENPRYRVDDLSLTKSMEGTSLLNEGYTILEIKVQDSLPIWLAEVLSKGRIYQSSFSKYGEAYSRQIARA